MPVVPEVAEGVPLRPQVTLLLVNACCNEALPLFLDELMHPVTNIIVSVTALLLFGEIIPQVRPPTRQAVFFVRKDPPSPVCTPVGGAVDMKGGGVFRPTWVWFSVG